MLILTLQDRPVSLVSDSDQERNTSRPIITTAILSLVVHLSLLVVFNRFYVAPQASETEAVTTTLAVEVRRPASISTEEIPPQTEPKRVETETLPEAAPPMTQALAEAVQPASETQPDTEKAPKEVPLVTSSKRGERTTALITTLPNSSSTGSVVEACDPQQQASDIRLCSTMPDHAVIAAGSQQFDGAFKDAFAHLNSTGGFRTDMVNLELLLAQWNQLEELANLGVVDASVVAVRQHEVSAQIEQIYARYEEIDLIKVIAATSQATKNIAKAVMGQKD
ncbi:MAG: hypothetical protein AAGI44_16165 [Pseudomonadota bacterium]